MIFSLSTIDGQGQTRDFSLMLNELEDGLDFFSRIAAQGHTLLQTSVREGPGCHLMPLPTEVFDGDLFSPPIQLLQNEWQRLLSQPDPVLTAHTQWLIACARHRIERHDAHVTLLELAIEDNHRHQHWVELTIFHQPQRAQLLARQEISLLQYQRQLGTALVRQLANSAHLSQLLKRQ